MLEYAAALDDALHVVGSQNQEHDEGPHDQPLTEMFCQVMANQSLSEVFGIALAAVHRDPRTDGINQDGMYQHVQRMQCPGKA